MRKARREAGKMLIWGWVAGWVCGMLCYKAVRESALRWIKKAEAQAEARARRGRRHGWSEDLGTGAEWTVR